MVCSCHKFCQGVTWRIHCVATVGIWLKKNVHVIAMLYRHLRASAVAMDGGNQVATCTCRASEAVLTRFWKCHFGPSAYAVVSKLEGIISC